MGTKAYLRISGTIFGVVALLHLARLIWQLPVQAGPWSIPVWVSAGGLVATGTLCVWAFRLART